MSVKISPLNLTLDNQNPRFVVLDKNDEKTIRLYMSMYEDVCQLTDEINKNNGLLLGERIVIIQENKQNIVMEGNRRTVALQFLLNRSLIPDGFQHKIPVVSQKTLSNIKIIEADIAPTRQYAISLMAKRHIEGVKQWKPLAKKQFFATMYISGTAITILSERTSISASEIRKDIRDYKLLLSVSKEYKQEHPDFDEDLVTYKIDPFLRIFTAGQDIGSGIKKSPCDILKIKYDDDENTLSDLTGDSFKNILKMVFKATIVDKTIQTRNTLFDVPGVKALIDTLEETADGGGTGEDTDGGIGGDTCGGTDEDTGEDTDGGTGRGTSGGTSGGMGGGTSGGNDGSGGTGGGPTPGGSGSGTFFEHISWRKKLDPGNTEHIGLIVALDELFRISNSFTKNDGRNTKIYEAFPVGTGMLLRTAYEQALILQLKKKGLWSNLVAQFQFPLLSNIETQVKNNTNIVLPILAMKKAFGQITSANSRDFLNSNVHNPGLIRTTSSTLEGLASGGMLSLIQLIINNI